MLHQFLVTNRTEILSRALERVITRDAPQPTHDELSVGVPRFLDELTARFGGAGSCGDVMHEDATRHGKDRERSGFTVAQVVHDYGGLCQAITELAIDLGAPIDTQEFKTLNGCLDDAIAKFVTACAIDLGAPIDTQEFKTLNGCLDDAIAHAVTNFATERERRSSDEEKQRLGFLAHELRNHLQTATLAYQVLKSGTVAIGGSTGAVLGRSLAGLQSLIDRTMAQVRLDAGVHHHEPVWIASFLEEVEAAGSILAQEQSMSLTIERGDPGVAVDGDRQLLGSAVANLLQNAFKFTRDNGQVRLGTTASAERVRIEVADQCGGLLSAAQVEGLFKPYDHRGNDTSGLGLGLAISKQAIESMGGVLRARNVPPVGCVFTIDLPRLSVRALS